MNAIIILFFIAVVIGLAAWARTPDPRDQQSDQESDQEYSLGAVMEWSRR